jgi:predicted nucleotidyltransferase
MAALANDIIAYVDELVAKFRPQRVVLFGSHVNGVTTDDSDVDLLVIHADAKRPAQLAAEMRRRTTHRFPLDLLVRTPSTVRQRLEWKDQFLTDVINHGIVLHDADDARVGDEGRRRLRDRLARDAVAPIT